MRCIPVMKYLKEIYEPHGLAIVALHRPEFSFEKSPFNMMDFIAAQGITYIVGLDTEDVAWNSWKVDMWPYHFLIIPSKSHEGLFYNAYTHVGDRNHHVLEEEIQKYLFTGLSPRPKIELHNHEKWLDAEIFFGKDHRVKNVSKTNESHEGCGEGACRIQNPAGISFGNSVPIPKFSDEYTVYGAAWCPFCRRAKFLLKIENIPFKYIDVDEHGGSTSVRDHLQSNGGLPENHNTIPIIYNCGNFLGGYTSLVEQFQKQGRASSETLMKVNSNSGVGYVDYHKGVITASITINDTNAWTTTKESLVSLADNSVLDFSFHVDISGVDDSLKPMYMYIVAEGKNELGISQTQKEILEKIPGFSLLNIDCFFSQKEVNYITEGKFVSVPIPGNKFEEKNH